MGSIPKSLGKYQILGPIGKGGMGEVFKAYQPDLNRHVAIKTLLAGEHASEDFLQRFQREARLAAKLVHPNIVQIHDFGAEGRLHYIVMEYVEGRSLKDVMAEKTLEPETSLRIAHSVARALKFAHDQKIIHRDIKPANILIDRQGRVRILDFGLAKSLSDGKALSGSGALIGTPYYMSPEQAFAAPEEVDARTDLYSLGAVLYEMLTGRPPFEGGTVLAILRKIEEEDPPPAGLSPAVDELVRRALAKDPERRFQTAGEMADAIKGCLSGAEAAPGRPAPPEPPPPEPAPEAPRPRRAPLLIAGTLAAGLAAGVGLWSSLRPVPEPSSAAPSPTDRLRELEALLARSPDATSPELARFAEDPALRAILARHFAERGQFSRSWEFQRGYDRVIADLAGARSLQRFASPALFRLSIPRPRDLEGAGAFLFDAIARHLEGKEDAARLKLKNAEYAGAPAAHILLVRAHLDLWDVCLDPGGDTQKLALEQLRKDLDRSQDPLVLPLRAVAAQTAGDAAAARRAAEELKRRSPHAAESFVVSALLFQKAGRLDLATEELRTAQTLDPKNLDLSTLEIYFRWIEVLADPEHEKLDVDPDSLKMDLKTMGDALDARLRNDHYPAALFFRAVGRALESRWDEAEDDLHKMARRAPLDRITLDHERLQVFVGGATSRSRLLEAACELQLHLGRADAALTTAELITGDDLGEDEKKDLLRENHRRIARLSAANEKKALHHLEEALRLGAEAKDLKEDGDLGDLRQKPGFLELVRKYGH
jgi:serine/threonine protein kinase